MNGAQAIAKSLEMQGVKTVFGYPGVAICPLFDSLLETNIHSVLVRIEANAAHMASGMARLNGGVGVAICTSGPGATNLITGIATAYADSIPLVCITGQVNSALLGSDVFQEADITGAAESFVKYSYLVRKASDIPRILREAFYIASTGRPGPVLVDVPMDVQLAEVKKFVWPEEVNLRTYKPTYKGNTAQLKKLLKALSTSRRPILCTGGGVHLCQAAPAVRAFAEKYNIPVISTMMGIGTMPTQHPLYMGMLGNNGGMAANRAVVDADLVIMAGARLADRALSNPAELFKGKTLVHIDVDPAEIGKNAPVTIPIVGDVKAVFEELLELEPVECATDAWRQTLRVYRQKPSARKAPERFVDPAAFVHTLSLSMQENAVYVADVGQNQIWSCANIVMREGRLMTSGGMGTMGYAIPAAIGAQLADPDRQVVAVCGDGSFQMSMMELATMKQENCPVKIVVLNNGFLGMVREYQRNAYEERYTMVKLNSFPRLDKMAEAYDLPYIRIENMQEMPEKVNQMLQTPGAVLMECLIDPMDIVKN